MNPVMQYFSNDIMAIDAWKNKYRMSDAQGNPLEESPADMHLRLAKEFARKEIEYIPIESQRINTGEADKLSQLSKFGRELFLKRLHQTNEQVVDEVFSYFDRFGKIVPQGSIMTNLGNPHIFGSLSNCFGIEPPRDSYGGLLKTDQELVQLMKRRGGVGLSLDEIRPSGALVSNASKVSTGVPSFAGRFSNSTREVALEGRRGALIELLHVAHPDIFKFVRMKDNRDEVTGANVSVKFIDKFMEAVEAKEDFLCKFPINTEFDETFELKEYNKLYQIGSKYIMKIKADELFQEFIEMSWKNAEPGAAYLDTIQNYSPDGVYEVYMPKVANPCGEQWFSYNETCRLILENLFGIIVKPFTGEAHVDYKLLYEMSYIQQRLGDDLVDLEVEHIDRIMAKIENDPEPEDIKSVELNLWKKIRKMAVGGRRTGSGLTALGDMLAAIGMRYGSPESIGVVKAVMSTKMKAELDATIDMAILRGTFEGWDSKLEFEFTKSSPMGIRNSTWIGQNNFYAMLIDEFSEQSLRMQIHGRRNVSWSTISPAGTVSLMTQTTSGCEPLFMAYYIRRRKINPNDKDSRVDFTDQNGDKWQEYPILHPKFKEWIKIYLINSVEFRDSLLRKYKLEVRQYDLELMSTLIDSLSKNSIDELFKLSPWYGSQAADIKWEDRIAMNAVLQKYTSNAISCTINLPENISKETVYNLYMQAWKSGLKGLTIYREGSRTGVLVSNKHITTTDKFGYNDAIKRPKELEADYHFVVANGKSYAVIVGLLDGNPYEVFAFGDSPLFKEKQRGKIIKVQSGIYKFVSDSYSYVVDNIQTTHPDEQLVTRWASLLLRHGTNPKYVAGQVEKSNVYITSFCAAIARVLKSYIPDQPTKEECPICHEKAIVYESGCQRCLNCGNSKC